MRHELLAPAGSPETLRAVIAAGADAVYLGGDRYGARAYATNFSGTEILEAMDYAHLHGRKIFLTVNTLLKNREIGEDLYDYLKPFYENGLDAIIVQDYGVFWFIKNYFPGLPIHASTQMSVAGALGAAFLKKQGCSRIITARELSIDEIRDIHTKTGMEIECFVHGALCYCYSGQCLMSSLLGGRSGNRGRCAQPCRLAYEVEDAQGRVYRRANRYPLSPKDLCTINLLPELCEAGVCSFKIEGRMKQTGYAAGVTAVYRKYLDLYEENPDRYCVEERDLEFLRNLGSRGGFTDGYFHRRNGREMMSLADSSFHSDPESAAVPEKLPKIPADGRAVFQKGRPASLELVCSGAGTVQGENPPVFGNSYRVQVSRKEAQPVENHPQAVEEVQDRLGETDGTPFAFRVQVTGAEVRPAENHPLTVEEVRDRLGKTGGTPFSLVQLDVVMDADVFLPVREINELRRRALAKLEKQMLSGFFRKPVPERSAGSNAAGEKDPNNRKDFLSVPEGTDSPTAVFSGAAFPKAVTTAGKAAIPRAVGVGTAKAGRPFLNVQISSERMLDDVLGNPLVDMISLDLPIEDAVLRCAARIREEGKRAGLFLPYVLRRDAAVRIGRMAAGRPRLSDLFERIFVRSYDGLAFAREALEFPPARTVADHSLYVTSNTARMAFAQAGAERYTASAELNGKELRHMENAQGELPLYGCQPLMVSAQCVYKNYAFCTKERGRDPGDFYLRDRYDKKFFIKKDCGNCYNVIYNCQPLYLLCQWREVSSPGFGSYRLSFVRENGQRIREVLDACGRAFAGGENIAKPSWQEGYTNGHFHRGVE